MKKDERVKRIIARGESGNHCHVITGDVIIEEKNGKTIIIVGEDSNAVLKHLLEKEWMQGKEVWTQEHEDIKFAPGRYECVAQVEYDPYNEVIRQVRD